jgi:hypothetical protein
MIWEVRLYIERAREASFHFARSTWEARHARGMRKNIIYEGPTDVFFVLFFKLLLSDKTWTKNRRKMHSSCLYVKLQLLLFAQAIKINILERDIFILLIINCIVWNLNLDSSLYYHHISHTSKVPCKYGSNYFLREPDIKILRNTYLFNKEHKIFLLAKDHITCLIN